MARLLLASALGLLIAVPTAYAQPKKQPTPPPTTPDQPAPPPTADGGKEVDLPEDTGPSVDPTGVNENPDQAKDEGMGVIDARANTEPEKPKPTRKNYPIEETLRPITLPALMSEAGLDIRNRLEPYDGNSTLRGRFGITRQWQVGLEYNVGGFFDDVGGENKVKFNTGKSIGVDVTYLMFNWLGIRVALPFYLDPFAMGVTIGAPLKFRLGDRFAFGGMSDFLTIKISKFAPSTTDEQINDANSYLVDSGSKTSRGALNFTGFATYQAKPNIAVGGDVGLRYEDFNDVETPVSIRARAQYSTSNKLDFGGAFGINDLSDVNNSLQLNLWAQLRI